MFNSGNEHGSEGKIHEFFLDEELLLFSNQNHHLYRLNTSAAFIWCYYAEGASSQDIIRAMIDVFGVPAEKAQSDVRESLAEWRQRGLVDAPKTPSTEENGSLCQESSGLVAVTSSPVPEGSLTDAYEHHYCLAGTYFGIRFATLEAQQAVHPLLAHLEVTAHSPFDTGFVLDITKNSEGYLLSRNTTPLISCNNLWELGPLIHGELLLTICKSTNSLAVVHAAAVTNKDHAILFPGNSGSGKSTLAAALIAAGYGYLSDEIALLTHRPYRALPVPLSLSMKEGAWPALSPSHPSIKKLPIYQRQDGKKVRYLPPPPILNQETTGYPVKWIIFPRYVADIPLQVQSLSRAEALYRIAEGGYNVNSDLSANTVSELVNWISDIKCFEMSYSHLPEALDFIQATLGKNDQT